MNVKEVIALLSKMPDKNVEILLDCPWCGKSDGIGSLQEVVLASNKPTAERKGTTK